MGQYLSSAWWYQEQPTNADSASRDSEVPPAPTLDGPHGEWTTADWLGSAGIAHVVAGSLLNEAGSARGGELEAMRALGRSGMTQAGLEQRLASGGLLRRVAAAMLPRLTELGADDHSATGAELHSKVQLAVHTTHTGLLATTAHLPSMAVCERRRRLRAGVQRVARLLRRARG
jgi:hypothetical protein